jgi:hypothetical protein
MFESFNKQIEIKLCYLKGENITQEIVVSFDSVSDRS